MKFIEFWFFTKVTAKEAVKSYFAPLKIIGAFFGILVEMFRQFFICMAMDSDEFKALQELKLQEETDRLVAEGLPVEDVEEEI